MTPQQIDAMKLALGALEIEEAQTHYPSQFLLRAITAIKEVLAEHAMSEVQRLGQEIEPKIGCVNHDCDQCKAEQEPVCPDCKAKVLYECVACSSNNYPPKGTT